MVDYPIIHLLRYWILEKDPEIRVSSADYDHWVCLDHVDGTRLGGVTLIYPGQGTRQALQYDWYPPREDNPNRIYRRKIWNLTDPDCFTEVLETAHAIRNNQPVEWTTTYVVETIGGRDHLKERQCQNDTK